jgi:ABC-type proline/glycine betaine transport system substrate-binding protein
MLVDTRSAGPRGSIRLGRKYAVALIAGLLIPVAAGAAIAGPNHPGAAHTSPGHTAVLADLGWDSGTAPTATTPPPR